MKGNSTKSDADVSRSDNSPPEKSIENGDSTETLSIDEVIAIHQMLRMRRLHKGKQLMENCEEDEERFIHNREINQNDDDENEDDDGDAEEEEADEQRPMLAKDFYLVEAIRKKRKHKGVIQYLIKWREWPESANTWEPIENLQACPDLIKEVEERSQTGKRKSGRGRKRRHGVTPLPQSKKKKQEERPHKLIQDSSLSATVIDSFNAVETEAGPMIDSVNATEITEVGAMVDFSNGSRSENLNKLDDVSTHVQEPVAPESVALMNENEVAIADGHDASSQSGRQAGARRRKSGVVKRCKPESSSSAVDNAQDGLIRTNTNIIHNHGLDPNNAECHEFTKVIKAASDTTQEVPAAFFAMRADGKEVFVTNKYLRVHHPLLLIDFYEQDFRYNATA